MNQILARTYTVTVVMKVQFTIRAMSLEDAQEFGESLVDNERDHINMEVDGSDVDWIIVKSSKAEEKQE